MKHYDYVPELDGPQSYVTCGRRILCKGGGGGGGSSTTVQEIPAELKPLANRYTSEAFKIYDTPYQAYGDQRYADLNGIQNQAIGQTMNRAMGGSPTMNAAEGALGSFYGASNPYLDAMVKRAQDSVVSGYNSAATGSGSFGNANLGTNLADSLGNVATQMYGGAYAQDQANKLQAISMAPTFGNQAYTDASQLMKAGQTLQDQAQQGLDFNYQQFLDAQNDPYKKQAMAAGVFGTNLGGTSKTESTQSSGGK